MRPRTSTGFSSKSTILSVLSLDGMFEDGLAEDVDFALC